MERLEETGLDFKDGLLDEGLALEVTITIEPDPRKWSFF